MGDVRDALHSPRMDKGRMEAFSDGVIAVIITIMVLEIKVPRGTDLASLEPLCVPMLGYALSFVYIGIYWNNHHHMLHAARSVSGAALWANLHLLFWLSIVPVVTTWVGENPTQTLPTTLYGVVLLCAGTAYLILQRVLLGLSGKDSPLARAIGRDRKGPVSALLYVAAIGLFFVRPWMAQIVFVVVA